MEIEEVEDVEPKEAPPWAKTTCVPTLKGTPPKVDIQGQKVPVTPQAVPSAAPVTPPTALAAAAPTGTQFFDREMLLRENAALKAQVTEINAEVEAMLKGLESIDFQALEVLAVKK